MTKSWKHQVAPLITLLFGAFLTFAGCDTKGPAEKAGATIDTGIQNAKDVINPPGPTEKAGRAIDKALKN